MSWSSPPSSPTPHPPLLPARPLTLGEIAGGAWRVYRAKFGLFVKLLVMPYLLMLAATAVFVVALMGMFAATFPQPEALSGPAIVLIGVFYIAIMLISLLVYVYQGRIVVGGIDLATGREDPTSSNLAARTRGMLGRVVVLLLLALAAGLVVGLLFIFSLVPVAASGGRGGDGTGAVLLVVLAMPVLYVAMIWLAIKLTYVIPAMAEEDLTAVDAIKRSFGLTRGAFWRTLGYQLVLGLIAMGVMMVPYLVLMGGAVGASAANSGELSPGAILVAALGLVAFYAAIVLFVPYHYLFVGLMYLSRTREQGAPLGGWSPTPVPGPYSSPYGQAPPPYAGPQQYSAFDPYGQRQQPYGQGQQPYGQGQPYQGQQPYSGQPAPQYPQNPWGPPPSAPGGGSAPQG